MQEPNKITHDFMCNLHANVAKKSVCLIYGYRCPCLLTLYMAFRGMHSYQHTFRGPDTVHPLQEQRSHSGWINAIKGTCMVLVVILHISLWADSELAESALLRISLFLVPFRIPVFFLISGILAASSLMNNPHRAATRAINIYTVYLIWTTIITLRFHATPGASDDPSLTAYVVNALVPGHYWYLWALPVYYGLSLLLLRISPKRPWIWLPVMLVVYYYTAELAGLARSVFSITAETVYWEKAFSCLLWFWTGVCGSHVLRLFGDRALSSPAPARYFNQTSTRIALILASVGLIFSISVGHIDIGRWNEAALSLAFATIALIVFPPITDTWLSKALQYIGKNTLSVYIFHKIFLIVIMAAESRTRLLAGQMSDHADLAVLLLAPLLIAMSLVLGRFIKASPLAFLLNGFVTGKGRPHPRVTPAQ